MNHFMGNKRNLAFSFVHDCDCDRDRAAIVIGWCTQANSKSDEYEIDRKSFYKYARRRWLERFVDICSLPSHSFSSSTHHGTIFGIRPTPGLWSTVVFVRYPRGWTRHIDLKILLNTCDRSYHRYHLSSSFFVTLSAIISVNRTLPVIMLINNILLIILNAYVSMCMYVCCVCMCVHVYTCVYVSRLRARARNCPFNNYVTTC